MDSILRFQLSSDFLLLLSLIAASITLSCEFEHVF